MSDFDDDRPFYSTRTEEERSEDKRKVFTISLNAEEQAMLIEDMRSLKQAKDSTALKQLWKIGRIVLHSQKQQEINDVIFENLRKNERIGISDINGVLPTPPANVTQKRRDL
jgi:hypothetical protein